MKKTNNDEVCAFANAPTNKKLIKRICLGSKKSIMKNRPSSLNQHDNNLSVIAPDESVRNALMLGVKVKLIIARHMDEDISEVKYNVASDGHGLLEDVKKLACKCNVFDKDFCTLL